VTIFWSSPASQKEAAGNASGPSLGGVPKEEKDTAASILGCA
jgi:hypothetical protein